MAMPAATSNTAQNVKPAFRAITQHSDDDCAFACTAMIVGKTLEEVRQTAIKTIKHPAHGQSWPLSETQIASLLAAFGMVASVYKPLPKGIADLPEGVSIVIVEYREQDELGRHVVVVKGAGVLYAQDPAYWIDEGLRVRDDFANLGPAWYIAVTPMKKPPAQAAK